MPLVIKPAQLTAYQLPEDAKVAKEDFLRYFSDPSETWLRAYALTMPDLVEDIIAAHRSGVPLHLYLDHTQFVGHFERPLVEKLVEAGVEVTIGTSPAGSGYIAHEKGFATANGDCWEGSTNFSDSAWLQVNTAFCFHSPEWRDLTVEAFNRAVTYAWTHERELQLMPSPPELRTP